MTTPETPTAPVRTQGRKKFLHYVFTTALEGGIQHWARLMEYHWSIPGNTEGYPDFGADYDGFYATIVNRSFEDDWGISHLVTGYGLGENEPILIDIDIIERGMNLFVDKVIAAAKSEDPEAPFSRGYWRGLVVQWLTDLEYGDSDAEVCDAIIQLGLFGEVVYA